MKKKIIPAFTAALLMFLAASCQRTEENWDVQATRPPVEAVTNAPAQEIEGITMPEGEEDNSAQGTEEESYELRYSFCEETEEEKDGEFVYFRSTLYYPVFEGECAEVMNRFVDSMTEAFRAYLPEAKENAKFNYEDSLSDEYVDSIFPEEETFIVSCYWETEQYVTLFAQCISNTGGVHPNVACQAYVVELAKGSQERLERMLEPYGLTTENVVAYTTEKIRAEHGEDLFVYDNPDDLEKDVQRFVQNNQWYFNDKGLVLFANPYEIAAYAYGMIECEISYEELEQGLKK